MFFQLLVHGEFGGLDENTESAPSAAAIFVPPPRDTRTYFYKTGVYGKCSAECNGGMRYRSVECWMKDPRNPRVVDETRCIAQRLLRPQSEEVCNRQRCVHATHSVSSFSSVSDDWEQKHPTVNQCGSRSSQDPTNINCQILRNK